jgi:low affinity Fe/Cu permease
MRHSPYDSFRAFAHRVALAVGTPGAFGIALLLVFAWGVTGPVFRYSDSWQLTINTGTTIITFLMVFVIQNTQNRDAQVVHRKLDELIRAVQEARNELVDGRSSRRSAARIATPVRVPATNGGGRAAGELVGWNPSER